MRNNKEIAKKVPGLHKKLGEIRRSMDRLAFPLSAGEDGRAGRLLAIASQNISNPKRNSWMEV